MPREFSTYQGAAPTPPKRQQVVVPKIDDAPLRGAQVDRAIEGVSKLALQAADLHDLGEQQREELALKKLEAERKKDFDERCALTWGDEKSFFNKDGTRNQNAIDEFNATYSEENDSISRNYLLGKNMMQGQKRHDEVQQRLRDGLEADIRSVELQNVKAVWHDNFEAEVLRENYGTARSMVDEAVQRGLLRPSQGELMKLRLAKAAAKKEGMTEDNLAAMDDGTEEETTETETQTSETEEAEVSDLVELPDVDSQRPLTLQKVGKQTVESQPKKEPHDLSHAEGMLEKGNIDPYSRKVEHRPDGSIATVESFGVNMDGKEVLLPRVIDGKTVSVDAAIEHYKKTGQHLGKFDSPAHATAYAQKFHENQAAIYGGHSTDTAKESIGSLLNAPQDAALTFGGNDPFVKAGLLAMNDDDFSEIVRSSHVTEYAPSIRTDETTGASSLTLSQTEPEVVQAAAYTEKGSGSLTKDKYREFCYAKASSIVTDPSLKGLSDAEMKKYIIASVKVVRGEQDWFSGEQNPELSYQAFLEDIADRVVSTRNDDIDSATDRAFKGEAGLAGLEQLLSDIPNADFAALYQDDSGVKDIKDSWLADKRIEAAQKILPVYQKYRKQFAAETGAKLSEEDAIFDLTAPIGNNIEAFRDWYYKKGGVYEQKVKEYIKSAKLYCRQAAVDAVCEYRRQGGTDWAQEQMLMRQAIDKAKGDLSSHAANWQKWRENREANLQFTAQKYRREAEAVMPELRELQTDRAFADLDKKEQEKRDKEREEWEAEDAKAERKKAWRAEKDAAYAAVHPYAKKGTHVIKFQKDGGKDPVVTVTPEQYKQMLIDTKADKGQGIVCRFGNSSRRIAVKPGKVKGLRFNGAALFAIYGKHLTKEQLKSRVNLHKETITFEAF